MTDSHSPESFEIDPRVVAAGYVWLKDDELKIILSKLSKLQAANQRDRREIHRLRGLLREALPNLAEYVVMAADKPKSLWSRIHMELAQ